MARPFLQREVAPSLLVPIEEAAHHRFHPSHLHFAHPRRAHARLEHATMASDTSSQSSKPPMTAADLIAFVKKELDADEERQAKIAAASAGEVPRESQTGSTLDLSHKNINSLPVEVIVLIKDKVERYDMRGALGRRWHTRDHMLTLTRLAVSHNPRISLPTEIGQCDRLRYLNLRWNKLRQFPDAVRWRVTLRGRDRG